MKDLMIDGMAVSASVVDAIASIAASEVEGVACVGSSAGASGLIGALQAKSGGVPGIAIDADENEELVVTIHLEVFYGYVLPDLAVAVRTAVSEALAGQLGLKVARVDIFVDGLQFAA